MNFFRRITSSSTSSYTRRPDDDDGGAVRIDRPAKASRVVIAMDCEESCYAGVVESDTEPSLPARLDWRTDPDKSLSDWTIEVNAVVSSTDETKQSNHYHVHKTMLVLESEYFQSFFGQYPHATTADEYSPSATRLELHAKAARYFPDLLDYMYGRDLKLTSDNATVFHFFGHYFGMRRLRWEAKQFWQDDMTHETVATYFRDAILFGDPKIVRAVMEACCQDAILLRFQPHSPILQVPDPQLWLYLVEHVGRRHSEHLSRLVASFCSEHTVEPETFRQLTAPERLPAIAFSVTLILLDLERSIVGAMTDGEEEATQELTSLQDRCIASIEQRWSDVEVDKNEFSDFLVQQSSVFLAELFKRPLTTAQASHRSVQQELTAARVTPERQQLQNANNAASSDEEEWLEGVNPRSAAGHDGGNDENDDDAEDLSNGQGSDSEEENHLPSEVKNKCLVSNEEHEEAMLDHDQFP